MTSFLGVTKRVYAPFQAQRVLGDFSRAHRRLWVGASKDREILKGPDPRAGWVSASYSLANVANVIHAMSMTSVPFKSQSVPFRKIKGDGFFSMISYTRPFVPFVPLRKRL
jgi:hypothetical protein